MTTPITPTLGETIRRQRRLVLLTQSQLADALGLTQSAVARWESGETVPALSHRLRLAEVLCITPGALYGQVAA